MLAMRHTNEPGQALAPGCTTPPPHQPGLLKAIFGAAALIGGA